jgi:Cu+-exporting ATPase
VSAVEQAGYTAKPPRPAAALPAAQAAPGEADPAAAFRQRLLVSLVLSAPVVAMAMIPALEFPNWQWLSLTLAAPVAVWGRCRVTGWPG